MKKVLTCLIFSALFALAGCGNKVAFSGKVTFADDGSPLTIGSVCFVTDDYIAIGHLKPDGTYVVGSDSLKDGLRPGTYRVYLSGTTRENEEEGIPEKLVDDKYTSDATSELTCTVDASNRRFDFHVERPWNRLTPRP